MNEVKIPMHMIRLTDTSISLSSEIVEWLTENQIYYEIDT